MKRLACALAISLLCTTPAWAIPTFYTDRAAFDAAAGDYTLLTLDDPPVIVVHSPANFLSQAIYNDLMRFTFDRPEEMGVNDGTVTIGHQGIAAEGVSLQPVTAFGFDILPGAPATLGFFGQSFQIDQLSFLGVVSTTPFTAELSNALTHDPNAGTSWEPYTIDNIALRTVPEPSTLWLLAPAVVGLLWWRRSRTGTPSGIAQ